MLSAWRDRLLPEADAQRIALHVTDCAACQQRLDEFAQIAAAIHRQPAPDLRQQTWRGLQTRISQRGQQPMRIPRAAAFSGIGAIAVAALIIVLFVFALNHRPGGSSGPATTTATAVPVTVVSTIAVVASVVITSPPAPVSCSAALPGAGPASAGSSFTDLPMPANSVSTPLAQSGGGGAGQFTLYTLQLCTSGSSPTSINAFFAGITAQGWLHSTTFPADGSFQSNCTNSDCWAKDVRYVSLQEPISDLGGGIERYQLTLATAPPAPNCDNQGSTFSTGYYYKLPDPGYKSTNVYANIPLPPLSRIVPDDASGGVRGYGICSAGTVASITSFMNTQLTASGWSTTGGGNWVKSGYSLTVSVSSPTFWTISWHDPDLTT